MKAEASGPPPSPTRRELGWCLSLFLIGVFLRLALFSVALAASSHDLRGFLTRVDTLEYVALANMLSDGDPLALPTSGRLFLGWPAILAVTPLPIEPALEAVVLGSVLASTVAPVFWLTTRNRLGAILLVAMPPNWLMHSSLGMSEGALLALVTLAFWAASRKRPALAGGLVGLAAAIRPPIVFAAAGLLVGALRGGRRVAAVFALAALAGPIGHALLSDSHFGSWSHQVSASASIPNVDPELMARYRRFQPERLFANIPFASLIATPWLTSVRPWKIAYVYLTLALVLLATYLALRSLRREPEQVGWALWAVGNTAFIVSGGPYWGFHTFDRYALWALPAYVLFLTPLVRRFHLERPVWVASLLSFAIAAWAMSRT